MDAVVEHLQQFIRHAALGGGPKAIDRHKPRSKLRLSMLQSRVLHIIPLQ